MRLPLNLQIGSRDGTLNADPKVVNVYISNEYGRFVTVTRPGTSTLNSDLSGSGAGVYSIKSTTFIIATSTVGILSSSYSLSTLGAISNPNNTQVDSIND